MTPRFPRVVSLQMKTLNVERRTWNDLAECAHRMDRADGEAPSARFDDSKGL